MNLINSLKQMMIIGFVAICILFKSHATWANIMILHDPQSKQLLPAFSSEKVLSAIKSRFSRSGFIVYDDTYLTQMNDIFSLNREKLLSRSDVLAAKYPALKLIFVQMQIDLSKQENGIVGYALAADIYSVAERSFVSSWSLPVQTVSLPGDCIDSCFDTWLTDEMRRDSELLSKGLIQLLSVPSAYQSQSGLPIITFQLDLLDLTETETVQLIDLMRNEFPGFVEISSVRAQGPRQQFNYSTSASADKLREWLIISLSEIGLDPDTDIELVISDRQIDIRRYLPVSPLKSPAVRDSRFN